MDLLISLATNEIFKCLDMQMGGVYCRLGDGASQSHLHTQMSQGKPKQLSQKAFYLPGDSLTNDAITL